MGQDISLKSKMKKKTFSAHTINCVCHSIRSMFRVLGIYNSALTINKNTIYHQKKKKASKHVKLLIIAIPNKYLDNWHDMKTFCRPSNLTPSDFTLLISFGIGWKLRPIFSFGFCIGPKPKRSFRSYTIWKFAEARSLWWLLITNRAVSPLGLKPFLIALDFLNL